MKSTVVSVCGGTTVERGGCDFSKKMEEKKKKEGRGGQGGNLSVCHERPSLLDPVPQICWFATAKSLSSIYIEQYL
jgi:hypothetical protein